MVTFNLYLTKRWEAAWGGRLVWKHPRMEIVPSFNTLVLFNVGENTHHWVEPIAAGVTERRLSVTGWFLNTPDRHGAPKKKLNIKI